MSLPYRDADQISEAGEGVRNGIPLDRIAGHLRVTVEELHQLLDLPTAKPVPAADDDSGDLWAVDRLDGVL
ncbi:MAG: hypothetical protein WKF77_02320 [Planctomycetaceae bacterium]